MIGSFAPLNTQFSTNQTNTRSQECFLKLYEKMYVYLCMFYSRGFVEIIDS